MLTEASINSIIKAQQYQTAGWQEVILKARVYAQTKAFGTITDHHGVTRLHSSNVEAMLQAQLEDLKDAIMRAFAEDAMVGAAISSAREA